MPKRKGAPDKREQNWHSLFNDPGECQIVSLKIIRSNVFKEELEISFPRGLVLVGLHGMGKTVLLRTIAAAFGYIGYSLDGPPFFIDDRDDRRQSIPVVEGVVEVTLRIHGEDVTRVIDLSEPSRQRRGSWGNDGRGPNTAEYASPIKAFTEIDSAMMAYEERDIFDEFRKTWELKREDLDAVTNILGRSYQSLKLETLFEDEIESFLYFSGSSQGRTIDLATMSAGELWVLYVMWLINGLSAKQVLLLDEPEAFLAAIGRLPFVNQIVKQVLSKKTQLILATHSPEVLAKFPLPNIRICTRADESAGAKIDVIEPTSLAQVQQIVGMRVPVRALALVEDDLARKILSSIVSRYGDSLFHEVEIIVAGGEGNVTKGINIFGGTDRLGVFGVLDADQKPVKEQGRGEGQQTGEDNAPLLYLPGKAKPEDELLAVVRDQPGHIASIISLPVGEIKTALDPLRFIDHQYQMRELAAGLRHLDEDYLVNLLIQTWLDREEIRSQSEQLVADIRTRVDAQGLRPRRAT